MSAQPLPPAAAAAASSAAASSSAASSSSYCPVSALSDAFASSGSFVELEVLRCWPLSDSSVPGPRLLRVEAQDFRRASAACLSAAASASNVCGVRADTPIELFLYGLWSNIPVAKYDVLNLRRAPLQPSSTDGEHPLQFVLAEDDACAASSLQLRGWKARLLQREGREYTLDILAREQAEAEIAAAEATDRQIAEESKKRAAAAEAKLPANKRARTAARAATDAAAASSFQTAASLVAATAAAAAAAGAADAPILIDDSAPAAAASAASAPAAAASRKKRGSDIHGAYAYTPLGESRYRPKEKLNFYAVVIQVRPAKKSMYGPDYSVSLVASDPSLGSLNDSITFNIFRKTEALLPPPSTQRGDIVRIHRATVSNLPGQPDKFVGTVAEKGSGFILIRGAADAPVEPYFNTADTYSEIDADIIHSLRAWAASQLAFRIQAPPRALAEQTYTASLFSQLNPLEKTFCDVLVRIVAVDPTASLLPSLYGGVHAGPSTPLVYIWDGTDLPKSVHFQRGMLPNNIELPPPWGAGAAASAADQSRLGFAAAAASSSSAAAAAAATPSATRTPAFGSILPIAVPGGAGPLAQFYPASGRPSVYFAKLRNIAFARGPDQLWYLQFTQYSKFIPMSGGGEGAAEVKKMMERFRARAERETASMRLLPWTTLQPVPLTAPSLPDLPYTPLKMLHAPDAPAVSKHRIRARVLAIVPDPHEADAAVAAGAGSAAAAAVAETKEGEAQPVRPPSFQSISKVCCPRCFTVSPCRSVGSDSCASCGHGLVDYKYYLSLLLADATGTAEVLLTGEDAQALLPGLPADNFFRNEASLKFVRARLANLMQPGAWIDCHLHAYEVAEEAEAEGGGAAGAGASQMPNGSQQEYFSQDLEAFFAPQIPGQNMAEEEAEGQQRAPPMRVRRVFRMTDCMARAS